MIKKIIFFFFLNQALFFQSFANATNAVDQSALFITLPGVYCGERGNKQPVSIDKDTSEISLSQCSGVDKNTIETIVHFFPNLKTLELIACNLTNETLEPMLKLSELVALDLSFNPLLTNIIYYKIISSFLELREISLLGSFIDGAGLRSLSWADLEVIYLDDANLLEPEDFANFKSVSLTSIIMFAEEASIEPNEIVHYEGDFKKFWAGFKKLNEYSLRARNFCTYQDMNYIECLTGYKEHLLNLFCAELNIETGFCSMKIIQQKIQAEKEKNKNNIIQETLPNILASQCKMMKLYHANCNDKNTDFFMRHIQLKIHPDKIPTNLSHSKQQYLINYQETLGKLKAFKKQVYQEINKI
ncbi:MAG: hypothetical protein K2X39_03770 [Silvanigrellaceae bacterium]|nr:hypothetical protein [Silvanigrellaceae bacterium]